MNLHRSISLSFMVTVSILVLNTLTGIVLARSLLPTDRGLLAAALLWPNVILAIVFPGLGEAVLVSVAKAEADMSRIVGSAYLIAFAASLVTVVIGLLTIPALLGGDQLEAKSASLHFLIAMPFSAGIYTAMGILNGLGHLKAIQGLRLSVVMIATLGILALWLTNTLTAYSAVTPYIVANVLVFVATLYLVFNSVRVTPRINRASLTGLLSFGLKGHFGNISSLVNLRLDQMLISIMLPPAALGIYTVAVTLASGPLLVGTSVQIVTTPAIARLGDLAAKTNRLRTLASTTFIMSSLIAIPLLLVMPQLCRLLFGADYHDATPVARILTLAAVMASIAIVMRAALLGLSLPFQSSLAEALASILTVAGLLLFLRPYGLISAGIVSLVAYSASAVYGTTAAAWHLDAKPLSLLRFSVPPQLHSRLKYWTRV